MKNIKAFIASGIMEQYVTGNTTAGESVEVEEMAMAFPEIRKALRDAEIALENDITAQAIAPDPGVKAFLMASIEYSERLNNGEPMEYPPIFHSESTIDQYASWLKRSDIELPAHFDGLFAKIISKTPLVMTAVVWLETGTSPEVHDNELEQFLILEGTCDIDIEGEVHSMEPGKFLRVPLHKWHRIKVTSAKLCKILLQRIAS
jgi:mannose-6-phosphate isomerase-like protein (cupin superfamily)